MPVICLIVGILIGLSLSRFIFKDKPIGSLRVDSSDPDSGPYLFLEVDPGRMDNIYKKQYVRLRVKIKNYISHK
ncbi:beta-lactamase induction signal transducer protein [[Eubacterium] rectale]|uniref:beta-lactamase induction signal transducer protein n=1 Tax=Agathobacter rectalis TaxID=39491 RepID=UPI0015702381|nr:beta-lactamase induction signal transducer protein [Agathobacter rectalis]NSI33216.1 beta-lactamase induction signal transducer protein [Agathobacter rectalis]